MQSRCCMRWRPADQSEIYAESRMIVQNLAARLGLAVKRQGRSIQVGHPGGPDWRWPAGPGYLATPRHPPGRRRAAECARYRPRGADHESLALPGCERAAHPFFSIVAEAGLEPDDIEAVTVTVRQDPRETATFRDPPCTPLEAKFSLPYVMTAAWLDRTVTLATFDAEAHARIMSEDRMSRVGSTSTAACRTRRAWTCLTGPAPPARARRRAAACISGQRRSRQNSCTTSLLRSARA
jgi:hypothetical protein